MYPATLHSYRLEITNDCIIHVLCILYQIDLMAKLINQDKVGISLPFLGPKITSFVNIDQA